MKKWLALGLAAGLLVAMLSGCGGGTSSSISAEILPAPSNSAPADSSAAPQPASSAAPAGAYNVQDLAATLSEAANLGATIEVRELDLMAGGIEVKNIVEWAGAESKLSAENGGIVMVFYAPGQTGVLAGQLETFRDSRINENYAENAGAIANTKEARIVEKGDYVVYAVSATGADGGYATLDTAIEAAFA